MPRGARGFPPPRPGGARERRSPAASQETSRISTPFDRVTESSREPPPRMPPEPGSGGGSLSDPKNRAHRSDGRPEGGQGAAMDEHLALDLSSFSFSHARTAPCCIVGRRRCSISGRASTRVFVLPGRRPCRRTMRNSSPLGRGPIASPGLQGGDGVAQRRRQRLGRHPAHVAAPGGSHADGSTGLGQATEVLALSQGRLDLLVRRPSSSTAITCSHTSSVWSSSAFASWYRRACSSVTVSPADERTADLRHQDVDAHVRKERRVVEPPLLHPRAEASRSPKRRGAAARRSRRAPAPSR